MTTDLSSISAGRNGELEVASELPVEGHTIVKRSFVNPQLGTSQKT
jgi:hypothetical protein